MSLTTYEEPFLPLRFFLHTVAVHCPSCHEGGMITTDMPAVFEQEEITSLFDDIGLISYASDYTWKNARFLCRFCQKQCHADKDHLLKTWQGPFIGKAEALCTTCKEAGYTQRLSITKHYSSKHHLPKNAEIFCDKCHTSTTAIWNFSAVFSSLPVIDPIFGLKLFATTQVKNQVLWVYNLEHLQHLESYIRATQRKIIFNIKHSSGSKPREREAILSFSQQLPQIFKLGSNRDKVLSALALLRKKLV